jgi:inner membrane protein
MPTVFTHAVSALALGTVVLPPKTGSRAWTLGVLCAIVPDLDVVAFALGISYSDMLGHRGLSHSLMFALTLSILVAALAFRGSNWNGARLRIWLFLFLATASHGILDAFTNGGMGIAFFAPFSTERYFFPVTPIEVSPIGRGFLSERGLQVMASEVVWVWMPSLVVVGIVFALRYGRGKPSS